jgi:PKD repeat protein
MSLKNKTLISIFILFFSFFSFSAFAGSEHNVWGFAWGGKPEVEGGVLKAGSGWISFNCYNDYNNDGILESHCSPTPGFNSNYGVNISTSTLKFSGRAWSGGGGEGGNPKGVFGWLSFERSETGAPPSDDPCPDGSCIAKIGDINPSICDKNNNGYLDTQCGGRDNSSTPISNYKQIFGWARFCGIPEGGGSIVCGGGGWDGWIKFSHQSPSDPKRNYGTVLNLSSNPQKFLGWAWGSDVVGWISFNCENLNSCATSNYFVATNLSFNQPPYVSDLITSSPEYCNIGSGLGQINLSFRYNDPDGDLQSQYQVQVQSTGGTPYVDCTVDAKVSNGTQESVAIRISQSPTSQLCDLPSYLGDVPFNTSLQWRVRVKDNQGNWSAWSSWIPFSTAPHPYPYVDFSWTPTRPAPGEIVQFNNLSQIFVPGGPSFLWTFTNANPSTATTTNATTTFTLPGNQSVTLRVTDSSGYYCERTRTINVFKPPYYFPLPPFQP